MINIFFGPRVRFGTTARSSVFFLFWEKKRTRPRRWWSLIIKQTLKYAVRICDLGPPNPNFEHNNNADYYIGVILLSVSFCFCPSKRISPFFYIKFPFYLLLRSTQEGDKFWNPSKNQSTCRGEAVFGSLLPPWVALLLLLLIVGVRGRSARHDWACPQKLVTGGPNWCWGWILCFLKIVSRA